MTRELESKVFFFCFRVLYFWEIGSQVIDPIFQSTKLDDIYLIDIVYNQHSYILSILHIFFVEEMPRVSNFETYRVVCGTKQTSLKILRFNLFRSSGTQLLFLGGTNLG